MKKEMFLLAVIALLLFPIVNAKENHLKLLAVSETEKGYEGSSADLYLEIKEGTGRVFLDTFPLTKMDTQMSTRFAKSIACSFLDMDCESYDFFYTIRADSAIIGGPSAGAAIAALTAAALKGINLDESVAITGTINSGGIIGPVGGLKEKIDAANSLKLRKVLIPRGERFVKEDNIKFDEGIINIIMDKSNKTIDLVEYGKKYGIEVVEVASLNDVIYEFTGQRLKEDVESLNIDPQYEQIMRGIAEEMCGRSESLRLQIKNVSDEYKPLQESALNYTSDGKSYFEEGKYYSSASFCFGANIKLSELALLSENLTNEQMLKEESSARDSLNSFNNLIEEKKYKTITDLQIYMIVKERVIEAEDYLNKTTGKINTSDAIYNLAFSNERLNSAKSWSNFFDKGGREFFFNKDTLRSSCLTKLSEAEERYQYITLIFPTSLESTKQEIDRAREDSEKGDYELCLFKASKAKAEANSILTAMDTREEELRSVVEEKLKVIRNNIAEEQEKGIFPILGYSYYEYADVLNEKDPYSALLYSEYALELSNQNMYFSELNNVKIKKPEQKPEKNNNKTIIYVFIYGVVVGYVFSIILRRPKKLPEGKKPLEGLPRKTPRGKKR